MVGILYSHSLCLFVFPPSGLGRLQTDKGKWGPTAPLCDLQLRKALLRSTKRKASCFPGPKPGSPGPPPVSRLRAADLRAPPRAAPVNSEKHSCRDDDEEESVALAPTSMSSSILDALKKAKTKRARRFLEARVPKVFENPKKTVVLKGRKSSETINDVLEELFLLKKPHAIKYTRKHDILPFEDASAVESFSRKLDASLFVVGSHSKKRPENLIIGRTFDYNLYDMVEFHVEAFSPIEVVRTQIGSKPLIIFQGDQFEHDSQLGQIKSLLLDFFRGEEAKRVSLSGLDTALVFTCVGKRIFMCLYNVDQKHTGATAPRAELRDTGLSMILSVRRSHQPSTEMEREARRKPKQAAERKKKNIETDSMGNILGRVHLDKQNFHEMPLRARKMAGIGRRSRSAAAASSRNETTGAGMETVLREEEEQVLRQDSEASQPPSKKPRRAK